MASNNTTPPLIEPPASEVMPFEAFENLMSSTSIDEIYKYYDSDGTVDLEDTYDGSSSCDDDDPNPPLAPAENDADAEIRDAERYDRANASRHNDQKLQDLVHHTQVVLEQLSIAAQPVLEEQPLSTRIILANQAVSVLERYGSHGSMHRFSEDVRRFLEGGERVKRPGVEGRDPKKDAILRFAPINSAKQPNHNTANGKKGSKRKDSCSGQNMNVRKERKVEAGTSVSSTKVNIDKKTTGQNSSGDAEKENEQSKPYRSNKPKPVLPHIQTGRIDSSPSIVGNGRPMNVPASPSSALARFNLNSPVSHTPPQTKANRHAYSCSTHPSLNAHLATQPYDPISLDFTWPATSRQNANPTMPTPGVLDALNNILHLFNAEARFMLSYYVRKFETPAECGGVGSTQQSPHDRYGQNVEPPHALFRLGIAQYLWGKVGKVIDNKEVDELGLNPEARRLLGEVWERHPSTAAWWQDSLPVSQKASDETQSGAGSSRAGAIDEDPHSHESDFDPNASAYDTSDSEDNETVRAQKLKRKNARAERRRKRSEMETKKRQMALGGLNPWEKMVLARATNVSVRTVDAFWDDMREKTRAWGAMKMWCAAMEKKMIKKAKVEGRW